MTIYRGGTTVISIKHPGMFPTCRNTNIIFAHVGSHSVWLLGTHLTQTNECKERKDRKGNTMPAKYPLLP